MLFEMVFHQTLREKNKCRSSLTSYSHGGTFLSSSIYSAFKHASHVTCEHPLNCGPLFSRQLRKHLLDRLCRGAPCKHDFLRSFIVVIWDVGACFRVEAGHRTMPQLETLIINLVLADHLFEEQNCLRVSELIIHISILGVEKFSLGLIFFSCHDRYDGVIGGTSSGWEILLAIWIILRQRKDLVKPCIEDFELWLGQRRQFVIYQDLVVVDLLSRHASVGSFTTATAHCFSDSLRGRFNILI